MDPNQQTSGQTNTDTANQGENQQANNDQQQQQQQQPEGAAGDAGAAAGDQGSQSAAEGGEQGSSNSEINYDLQLPEGFTMDEAIAEQLTTFAKEKNLSAEEAQKLVDLGVQMRQKEAEAYQAAQKQWIEQVKADQEIGGAQLNENVAVAKKALDTFGTPELKGLLDSTGFGNHPEVVRAFYKIGKAISEDKLVIGEGKPKGGPRDPAKTLFPNQT